MATMVRVVELRPGVAEAFSWREEAREVFNSSMPATSIRNETGTGSPSTTRPAGIPSVDFGDDVLRDVVEAANGPCNSCRWGWRWQPEAASPWAVPSPDAHRLGNIKENSGRGEHAGLGVHGFAEILGADEGMVATEFGYDPVNMLTVFGGYATDVFGGVEEDALDTIGFLEAESVAALALEEGAGNPGGAPEDAGGIDGGGHGVEVLVELGGGDQLGFIDGEKQVGGGTHNPGALVAGEELQAGFAKPVFIAF